MFLDDFIGDLFVLLHDAGFGVDDEDGDVAAGDGIHGALGAVEFDGVIHAAGFAEAGGVNEDVFGADAVGLDLEGNIHGIAGGAGDGGDDDAGGVGEGVDDGGFADIGAADDGDLERSEGPGDAFGRRGGAVGGGLGLGGAFGAGGHGRGGQAGEGGVHEVFDAFAVNGADGENGGEAEADEFVGVFFLVGGVHFVDGHDDGLAAFAQALGDFLVEGDDAFLDIDDEDDGAGGFDGDFDLFKGGLDDDVGGLFTAQEADAAGVHEGVGAAVPFGLDADAVAGDAGLVVNDGDALADDAVEEGGFADIRAADDGDQI